MLDDPVTEGITELTVEKIIKHRAKGNEYEFLVKWKDFDDKHHTWHTADELVNITPMVQNYL